MPRDLRPPSTALQALLREKIAAQEVVTGLAGWPANSVTKHGLLLLHMDTAYVYGLSPDGRVLAVDTDDFQQRVEPAHPPFALNALAQAARTFPELRELLPERPLDARTCEICHGTGDEREIGNCACDGLGWRAATSS